MQDNITIKVFGRNDYQSILIERPGDVSLFYLIVNFFLELLATFIRLTMGKHEVIIVIFNP